MIFQNDQGMCYPQAPWKDPGMPSGGNHRMKKVWSTFNTIGTSSKWKKLLGWRCIPAINYIALTFEENISIPNTCLIFSRIFLYAGTRRAAARAFEILTAVSTESCSGIVLCNSNWTKGYHFSSVSWSFASVMSPVRKYPDAPSRKACASLRFPARRSSLIIDWNIMFCWSSSFGSAGGCRLVFSFHNPK